MGKLIRLGSLLLALGLGACTLAPPSADGVRAYLGNDAKLAEAELAPLAERGDATAQFYVAAMAIEGSLSSTLEASTVRDHLVSSASGGNDGALGLMVWLSANKDQRAEWLQIYRREVADSKGLPDDENLLNTLGTLGAFHQQLHDAMEDVAGGPIPTSAISNFYSLIDPETEDAFINAQLTLNDSDFLAVDQRRARSGSKEAQIRLALRHQTGRGVDQDDAQVIRLLRAAGSPSSAPRNCIYQPKVGKSPSSVQCYSYGSGTAGHPRAQWEMCQAYALGRYTEQNVDKAETWCNRAMQNSRYRTLARDVLIAMNASETGE